MTAFAYRIASGGLEEIPIPESGYELAEVPGVAALRNGDRPERADFRDYALPVIAGLSAQITPWATWYAAPAFTGSQDGIGWVGHVWCGRGVAALLSTSHSPYVVSACLHEAWHLCEDEIRPDLLSQLDAQLATGMAVPSGVFSSAWERRARAFEHFASYMIEGGRMNVAGEHIPFEVRLFWHVFSGDFGCEVMRARAATSPKPGRLRRMWNAVTSPGR